MFSAPRIAALAALLLLLPGPFDLRFGPVLLRTETQEVTTMTVVNQIFRLRARLCLRASGDLIESLKGEGFRFTVGFPPGSPSPG
jgi:hypothetical protein